MNKWIMSLAAAILAGYATLLAAVLAGIFTLGSVWIGARLQRESEEKVLDLIRKNEISTLIATRAQGRWIRAGNVMQSAGGSQFAERWDEYILNGFTPWNEDLFVMTDGVKRYFPRSEERFDTICNLFAEMNAALQPFHRKRGQPTAAERERAERKHERLEVEIRQLVQELFSDTAEAPASPSSHLPDAGWSGTRDGMEGLRRAGFVHGPGSARAPPTPPLG